MIQTCDYHRPSVAELRQQYAELFGGPRVGEPKAAAIRHARETATATEVAARFGLPKHEVTSICQGVQPARKRKPVESDRGEWFSSTVEAAKAMGVYRSAVTYAVGGRNFTCLGRRWRYSEHATRAAFEASKA